MASRIAKDDVLGRKPRIPHRPTSTLRHPSRTLGFGIEAWAIADGVEDEVG
ncbi:hypothetical protein [Sphingorhabdus sp.]|uniref:hypothetical protein n=1 Tax=Sphingorhabdus sp. TaxID=1902408 RepID=UPI003D8168C4